MNLIFDKQLYNLEAIKRAIIDFDDFIYVNLSQDDKNTILEIEPKDDSYDINKISKELKNKVLDEEIKINIENETKDIRDLVFKSAMAYFDKSNEAEQNV